MRSGGWRALALAAIGAGSIGANWNDTSTGIDLDKLPHFPLAKLRSGWLKDGESVRFDGIGATSGAGGRREVLLRGVGKSAKRWEAHLCCLDEMWRGDLDGDGTQDYVLFSAGPYYNGRMTPPFSLSILLMDRDQLPVPFFTVVYRGENGDGIKHLVDLDRDGRAELLISTYDENSSDPHVGPFCSGHWVNQLYRFRDLGVEEVRGAMGGIRFPLIHDWTYGNARCPGEGPFPVNPAVPFEHGTSAHNAVKVSGPRTPECKSILPEVVVYDQPRIREIGFHSPYDPFTEDLAERIWEDGAKAELRGVNREAGGDFCRANLLWATP